MMTLWLPLIGLLLVAVGFVAWPLWRYKNAGSTALINHHELEERLVENVRIFREHLSELENNFSAQAISAQEFSQLKVELERNLLADEQSLREQHAPSSQRLGVKVSLLLCAVIFLGGVLFFNQRSGLVDVHIQKLQQEKLQSDYQDMVQNRDPNPARAQELVAEYEARLKQKPDNIQYWFLLARAQMELGNFAEGAKAYQRVLSLDPQSSMIMAELAQAMFLADGNKVTPPVADLAKSALTLDPKNTMALGLLGINAFAQKDFRNAIRYWQKSVDLVGADSQGGRALLSGIEKAKQSFIAEGGKPEDLVVKSPYAVKLVVSLGSKVKAKSDQIVFVYARAWQGSPMPLAIARIKVGDLPASVQLDETMAMSPASSLATATDIEVVARISPSGSAKAEIGDWLAKKGPISMSSIPSDVQLEINEQLTAESIKP